MQEASALLNARIAAELSRKIKNSTSNMTKSDSPVGNQRPAFGQSMSNAEQNVSNPGPNRSNSEQAHETTDASDDSDEDYKEEDFDTDDEDEDEDEELDDYASAVARLADAAADLKARLKGRGRFDELTDAQRDAIFALLQDYSEATVAKIIAMPPPKGMNFRVSRQTVNRFKHDYLKAKAERRHAEHLKLAEEVLSSENPEHAFRETFERLLKTRLLTTDLAEIDTIDSLVATLARLRKQALAERKQTHAEQLARRAEP
jgi:hypothetical protein